MRDRKVWPGGWRAAVLVLVGVLAGAMFLQPVGAHVNKKLKHLMKHLNPIYLNEGQAAGGDLDGVFPNPDIATDAVDSPEIASNAVDSPEIAANAVGPGELAGNAVTTAKIADAAVATGDLADSAVTTAKIADAAVATEDLADSAVTTAKIAPDAVGSDQVSHQALTGNDLSFGAVNSFTVLDESLEANDIGTDEIGVSELRELTVVEASTAPFGDGQTAENGNYITRAVTARCNQTNAVISGGALWNSDVNDDEVFISRSHFVPSGGGLGPGWRVRGGVDVDADFVLTAQVFCFGNG